MYWNRLSSFSSNLESKSIKSSAAWIVLSTSSLSLRHNCCWIIIIVRLILIMWDSFISYWLIKFDFCQIKLIIFGLSDSQNKDNKFKSVSKSVSIEFTNLFSTFLLNILVLWRFHKSYKSVINSFHTGGEFWFILESSWVDLL